MNVYQIINQMGIYNNKSSSSAIHLIICKSIGKVKIYTFSEPSNAVLYVFHATAQVVHIITTFHACNN